MNNNGRFAAIDGGTGGDGAGRPRNGDSPWLTLGERLAKADVERVRREREDAETTVTLVADGLRVLRTRDGVPLTEDMITERARNIAASLTGIPLAGVRFGARRVREGHLGSSCECVDCVTAKAAIR